jgi:hypothetical protein
VQVLVVCFPDLRYFFPQLGDALSDGLLHGDRLAEDMDHGGRERGGKWPSPMSLIEVLGESNE